MLVGHVEPDYAVEDDGLDFDTGGAILIPDALDPEIDVDVFLVVVDEGCLGSVCGIFEAVGGLRIPLFW